MNTQEIEDLIKYLEKLEERFVRDYNFNEVLYQYEEDRLMIPHVIEHLQNYLKGATK